MKNKLTLVIDGNWLLMSRFFMVSNNFSMELPEESRIEASHNLAITLAQSINIILRRFDNIIDNIVFATDNKSWRKSIDIPSGVEVTYKGNRKSDVTLDMNNVFNTLNVLADNFKGQGITVSNSKGAEGDDWAWYWSRELNKQGTNVLLWTVDEDIKQLIQLDKSTAAFTAWYNDKNGIFFHKDMEEQSFSTVDFFLIQEFMNKSFYDIKNKIKKVTYIDPKDIICKKIFTGDSGDNIKPIFSTQRNGRIYKGTEKDYLKIDPSIFIDMWEYIKSDDKDSIIGKLDNIYNKLLLVKKLGDSYTSRSEFIDHFFYNLKLVWLDELVIPSEVISEMRKIEYSIIPVDKYNNIILNYKYMSGTDNTASKLFDMLDAPF